MAKKKEYKIIITVSDNGVQYEVVGSDVVKTEAVGVLELVKTIIIKDTISD